MNSITSSPGPSREHGVHTLTYGSSLLMKGIDGSKTDLNIFADAQLLRRLVFTEEQGVSRKRDLDGRDGEAFHVVAYYIKSQQDTNVSLMPVGTARIRKTTNCGVLKYDNTVAVVERVCTLKSYRKHGVGRAVMIAIEYCAARYWNLTECVVHAQEHAIPFYESLGYTVCSDVFLDGPSIPHRVMKKTLPPLKKTGRGKSHSATQFPPTLTSGGTPVGRSEHTSPKPSQVPSVALSSSASRSSLGDESPVALSFARGASEQLAVVGEGGDQPAADVGSNL